MRPLNDQMNQSLRSWLLGSDSAGLVAPIVRAMRSAQRLGVRCIDAHGCFSAAPVVWPKSDYRRAVGLVERLLAVLGHALELELAVEGPESFERACGVRPEDSWMFSRRSTLEALSGRMARPDALLSQGQLWFIEANNDSCLGGTIDPVVLSRVYLRSELWRRVTRSMPLSSVDPSERLASFWRECHQALGMSVIQPQMVDLEDDPFYKLATGLVSRFGVPYGYCLADELVCADDVRVGDRRPHFFVKNFRQRFIEYPADDAIVGPLQAALRRDDTALFTDDVALLRSQKLLFACLHQRIARFSADDQRFILEHTPWSARVFGSERVRVGGEWTDTRNLLDARHRADFVLKPSGREGGSGVVVGRHVTTAAWEAAVEHALEDRAGSYIVQRYHPPDLVELPLIRGDDGSVSFEARPVIYGLSYYGGPAGCHVRFSTAQQPVINPLQGATASTLLVARV